MEKKNKTKSALKCTSDPIPRKTKSRLALQKFLDGLKRQESDFVNESKQITQCVFLGALRLKPVPDIFQVTLQPISFSTQPNPCALSCNNARSVKNTKDNLLTEIKPIDSIHLKKQSRRNKTKSLIGSKKPKNRILELFNNQNILRKNLPEDTTRKESLKLKSAFKLQNKLKIKVGDIVGRNRKKQEKEVTRIIRNQFETKEDISPKGKVGLKSIQIKGVEKVNKPLEADNNNLKSDDKLNSVVKNIIIKNNYSEIDKALAQLKKNRRIQVKGLQDMELKIEQNMQVLSGKVATNCQFDTLQELPGGHIDNHVINNNFISKQDETVNFVDIDDDEIEDYLEIDQKIVADLEALIPQEDIEYMSKTLVRHVNESSENISEFNFTKIPDNESNCSLIISKPVEKLNSNCDNSCIDVLKDEFPNTTRNVRKTKLKKGSHRKNTHNGMRVYENNNQLDLTGEKSSDFDLSNTEYEIISLIDDANETSIPKIILKDTKKKRSTLLPELKKTETSTDTKSSFQVTTRILRRKADDLKQNVVKSESSSTIDIESSDENKNVDTVKLENVCKIKRISPETKRIEFINPLKLIPQNDTVENKINNLKTKVKNNTKLETEKEGTKLDDADDKKIKQIDEDIPQLINIEKSEWVPKKITRSSLLKCATDDIEEKLNVVDAEKTENGEVHIKSSNSTPENLKYKIKIRDISVISTDINQIKNAAEQDKEVTDNMEMRKPKVEIEVPKVKDEEIQITAKSDDVPKKKSKTKRQLRKEKNKLNDAVQTSNEIIEQVNKKVDKVEPKKSRELKALEQDSGTIQTVPKNGSRKRFKISHDVREENRKKSTLKQLKTTSKKTNKKIKNACNTLGGEVDPTGLVEIKAEPVVDTSGPDEKIVKESHEFREIDDENHTKNESKPEGIKRKSNEKAEEIVKKPKVKKKVANIQTSILRYLKPIEVKQNSKEVPVEVVQIQDKPQLASFKDEYNFEEEDEESCSLPSFGKIAARNSSLPKRNGDLQQSVRENGLDPTVPIEEKPEIQASSPVIKENLKKSRCKKNCLKKKKQKVVKEEESTLNNNEVSDSNEAIKCGKKKKKKKDKVSEETIDVIEKIVRGGGDYSQDSKDSIPDSMRKDLLNPNSALSQEIERRMQEDFYSEFPNYGPQEQEPYKRVYKCRVCLVVLKTYNKLKAHKKLHNVKNPYRCHECGKSYNDVEELAAHLRIHQGKMPYPCKKCDSSFWTNGQLERHQLVHVLKKVTPPARTPKKIFKCEECGKEFKKICDLERHTRVHTGEKPSVCNICNKRFQQAYNLNKHLLIHTQEKNFECVICQKRFGRNDVLNRHVLTHSIDKPFHCSICSKTFIRNTQLNLHLRKHHGMDPKATGKKTSLTPAASKSSD